MTEPTLERAAEDEMHCPTCNARQAWSNECRRCKCDLSLLQQYWRSSEAERQRCLRCLLAGQTHQALRHARRYGVLVGSTEASRLLGACLLLTDNWSDACTLAEETLRQSEISK